MGKALGYILSIIGLMIILFSSKIATLPVISTIAKISIYTIVVGVALIVVGVIFMMDGSSSGRVKQAAEEVPIYQGTGKNRKIVGYQKGK